MSPPETTSGAHPSFLNSTEAVHQGKEIDERTGALLTPIYMSTAYQQPSVAGYMSKGYNYSRCTNPTVDALEKRVAALENAQYPAVAFTTGMAACNALFATFLKTGDHVVITQCSYGGTNRAARVLYERQYGIEFTFVDFADLEAVRKAIIPGRTKMLVSETPCNPTLQMADIQAISEIAKEFSDVKPLLNEVLQDGDGPSWACVNGRIIHVCDTTMATPMVCRGLDFGADILLLSLTKYYCGHNINLGGALVTNDKGIYDMMHFKQNVMGSIIAPHTAFMILQTMKTMALRLKKQSDNAMLIAKHLQAHPKVEFVVYPGLPCHPQYDVAVKQHREGMHGGMVTFDVKGGVEAGRRVMDACQPPWVLAENLGATESIMTCPAVFTHGNMPKEIREKVKITDGLIRLSVGIEEPEDLIAALDKALEAA